MFSEAETARILGIRVPRGKTRSAFWISRAVTDGLPLSALESLVRQVAPGDNDFVYRFVSRPTLARRKKAAQALNDMSSPMAVSRSHIQEARKRAYRQPPKSPESLLSPSEGAKVARLAEVWAMARRVWGSEAEARAFLFRPHPMLEGGCPIDVVIADEFGRPLVEGILGRLQYGSAA